MPYPSLITDRASHLAYMVPTPWSYAGRRYVIALTDPFDGGEFGTVATVEAFRSDDSGETWTSAGQAADAVGLGHLGQTIQSKTESRYLYSVVAPPTAGTPALAILRFDMATDTFALIVTDGPTTLPGSGGLHQWYMAEADDDLIVQYNTAQNVVATATAHKSGGWAGAAPIFSGDSADFRVALGVVDAAGLRRHFLAAALDEGGYWRILHKSSDSGTEQQIGTPGPGPGGYELNAAEGAIRMTARRNGSVVIALASLGWAIEAWEAMTDTEPEWDQTLISDSFDSVHQAWWPAIITTPGGGVTVAWASIEYTESGPNLAEIQWATSISTGFWVGLNPATYTESVAEGTTFAYARGYVFHIDDGTGPNYTTLYYAPVSGPEDLGPMNRYYPQ
jgi:hypothetical protein